MPPETATEPDRVRPIMDISTRPSDALVAPANCDTGPVLDVVVEPVAPPVAGSPDPDASPEWTGRDWSEVCRNQVAGFRNDFQRARAEVESIRTRVLAEMTVAIQTAQRQAQTAWADAQAALRNAGNLTSGPPELAGSRCETTPTEPSPP